MYLVCLTSPNSWKKLQPAENHNQTLDDSVHGLTTLELMGMFRFFFSLTYYSDHHPLNRVYRVRVEVTNSVTLVQSFGSLTIVDLAGNESGTRGPVGEESPDHLSLYLPRFKFLIRFCFVKVWISLVK